ncbi:hypothetical protein DPK80_02390 [Salmonella enterica subsp. enterica serovar Kirkee]|nr:hypothetical protein [Salmonella enterica subsp. enterica serovar Kirkee]
MLIYGTGQYFYEGVVKLTNTKNSKVISFIKCHWRWCAVPALLFLGFFNGYIAVLTAGVSLWIIYIQCKYGSGEWYGTPSLVVLTLISILLSAKPAWEALTLLSPYKHVALNDLIMTIQKDADRCNPSTEKDRVQWLKIKENSLKLCTRQIIEEQREGVYRLQGIFLGVISTPFSLASTFFPDPASKPECLELLDDYQRICPCVPGSEFNEQLKTFKKI